MNYLCLCIQIHMVNLHTDNTQSCKEQRMQNMHGRSERCDYRIRGANICTLPRMLFDLTADSRQGAYRAIPIMELV